MSTWTNEKAEQLRELLPDEAGIDELIFIIGSLFAYYNIDNMQDVSFVCGAAAASYNEFLSRCAEEEDVH